MNPTYTATLDRAPVEGFRTCSWWPGDYSPGDGTRRIDAQMAAEWASRVKALPPDGLAVLDMETIRLERDVEIRPSFLRDELQLAMARLSRQAIGPGRHISIVGEWLYPVWYGGSIDLWLQRGSHLRDASIQRHRELADLWRTCECASFGCYVGRAVNDSAFPKGTLDRDLHYMAEQAELIRSTVSLSIPIYVWIQGRAGDPQELPLSKPEIDRYVARVRELGLIPVAWGDPKNSGLLYAALR